MESAWFDENVERGYWLMQTHDRRLLEAWIANWNDLIEFEMCPVITTEEASEKVAARMRSSTSRSSAGASTPTISGVERPPRKPTLNSGR